MTIQTEQLKHSLEELDVHLKKLNEFPRDLPHNTIISVRELITEVCDSTRDCLGIIFSILSEGT